mmetsp:Transcript_85553/g.184621  ORF Transcript_85553/g.184621 Transcript_85553/m.184621 type:complete len:628 (-) Transcript_85553:33-1916(-)
MFRCAVQMACGSPSSRRPKLPGASRAAHPACSKVVRRKVRRVQAERSGVGVQASDAQEGLGGGLQACQGPCRADGPEARGADLAPRRPDQVLGGARGGGLIEPPGQRRAQGRGAGGAVRTGASSARRVDGLLQGLAGIRGGETPAAASGCPEGGLALRPGGGDLGGHLQQGLLLLGGDLLALRRGVEARVGARRQGQEPPPAGRAVHHRDEPLADVAVEEAAVAAGRGGRARPAVRRHHRVQQPLTAGRDCADPACRAVLCGHAHAPPEEEALVGHPREAALLQDTELLALEGLARADLQRLPHLVLHADLDAVRLLLQRQLLLVHNPVALCEVLPLVEGHHRGEDEEQAARHAADDAAHLRVDAAVEGPEPPRADAENARVVAAVEAHQRVARKEEHRLRGRAQAVDERDGGPAQPCPSAREELKEVLVVPPAHAVVHPGAVVVHLQDARPARAAMVGSPRLVDVALLAPRVREAAVQAEARLGLDLQVLRSLGRDKVLVQVVAGRPRVGAGAPGVRDQQQQDAEVVPEAVQHGQQAVHPWHDDVDVDQQGAGGGDDVHEGRDAEPAQVDEARPPPIALPVMVGPPRLVGRGGRRRRKKARHPHDGRRELQQGGHLLHIASTEKPG